MGQCSNIVKSNLLTITVNSMFLWLSFILFQRNHIYERIVIVLLEEIKILRNYCYLTRLWINNNAGPKNIFN